MLKRHIGKKHASIINQENVDEDTTGTRVRTLFTEPYEIHVKDEINDLELFEDSIVVLKIYKLTGYEK